MLLAMYSASNSESGKHRCMAASIFITPPLNKSQHPNELLILSPKPGLKSVHNPPFLPLLFFTQWMDYATDRPEDHLFLRITHRCASPSQFQCIVPFARVLPHCFKRKCDFRFFQKILLSGSKKILICFVFFLSD